MNNTEKIRELLKQIQPLTVYPGGDLLKQALALLPCETCNGTGDNPKSAYIPPEPCSDCKSICKTCGGTGQVSEKAEGCGCVYCKAYLDGCQIQKPCPDCKGDLE